MAFAFLPFSLALVLAAEPIPPPALPWAALPANVDSGVRLEAALVVRDLRSYHSWWLHKRALLSEVTAGQTLFDSTTSPLGTFSMLEAVQNLLDLASPGTQPVPAALALFTWQGKMAVQGLIKVEPGFAERLHGHAGPWRGEVDTKAPDASSDDPLFVFSNPNAPQDPRLVGKIGADGWLRVAERPDLLLPGGGNDVVGVSAVLQDRLSTSEVVFVAQGGGELAQQVYDRIGSTAGQAAAQNIHSIAVAWSSDHERSAVLQVIVDAPLLAPLAQSLRQRESEDTVLAKVSGDAVGFMSVAVPPVVRKALPALLRGTLSAPPYNAPEAVVDALGHLHGRIAWMDYDSPGDWALMAELDSSSTAAQLLPAIHKWAVTLAKSLTPGATQAFELEKFGGSTPVLHLRPDPALEGPLLAVRDNTLLYVQQHSRLTKLLQGPTLGSSTLLQGPLTPLVRSGLTPARLAQSYLVLGSDGGWLDYLVWGTARLQTALANGQEPGPALRAFIESLPRALALASYMWMRTYDAAVTIDVADSLLVLQLTTSEI